MQDEVNEKTISLCVQCTRMTAGVLKAALRKYLNDRDRAKQNKVQVRQAAKRGRAQEKGRIKEQKHQQKKVPHGKTDNETVDGKRRPAVKHSDNESEYPFI